MPHTPEPDEDDLDAIPPPHPVVHVEQALLGALLLEPQRLRDVTGIGADAFSTPAHAALFTALSSLPAPDPAEHSQDTKWLGTVLAAAREQTRGLSALYLQQLIQVCRWPQHTPAYARIIEAEHARRRLAAAAQQLTRTAGDTTLPQRVATTLAEADALTTVVDDIAARFPPHAGSLPRTSAPAPATDLDEDAVDEEQLLLATATAHPGDIEQMRWLTASDFTQPLHAGLWQCLTALSQRRAPIDPVTVLWEARQRGLLGPEVRPQELLTVLADPFGAAEHWGERVLQRHLLATARHIGRHIEAFADDPATTSYQLVVGSRRALADLSAVRTRWRHATAPVSNKDTPVRARAASPPRAGPPQAAAPTTRISR
ncbi:DnaB-like helicase N-terminal domain-containing protein [Streptomyces sp. NBC_01022]|uniref:DnaB-like helicase N-terminal domain-containing protein n=1 Tax=Streptomyces sp. NBC_01022 TaxID=2903723 RepID=UPI002DD7F6CD|nr:DnaB-like helicase N-terminal domain-containing protein [Streptomyces sp. NBC_01022]WRZ86090.1 replicative DNA helicase [Streptomyces sp. NBC_01022]